MAQISKFAPAFLKFLCRLVLDPNFKVAHTALQLLQLVLRAKDLGQRTNLQNAVPALVQKLGDQNVEIRRETIKLFLQLMELLNSRSFVALLLPYLRAPLWHVREEVLKLLIMCFMRCNHEFDLFATCDGVAKLLDDEISKVRFVAREALATLAIRGDKQRVLELLFELVDRKEYNVLCDRIESQDLP